MVLGAIGVAMAMRAHLQQRVEILAIMKSIGARSSDILRIYLLQTVLLGLVGGVIGVLFGLGVEWVFPLLLGKLIPIHAALQLPWHSAIAGLATGILTTVLFCLPPLLQIRAVRPNLVLRRLVEEPSAQRSWWVRLRESKAQWITALVILLGLGAIAAALSRFHRDRALVRGSSVCAAGGDPGRGGAHLAAGARLSRPHPACTCDPGFAMAWQNLYRPGNQSAAVLAALGMGVMLILTVFLMQHGVIEEMKVTSGPNLPNIFLVDISSKELDGVKHLLKQQPAVRGELETLPSVAGRIISVDGTAADGLKLKNYPKRLLQTVSLTWSNGLPAGSHPGRRQVVGQGRWAIAGHYRAHRAAASFASWLAPGAGLERPNDSGRSQRDYSSQWPACICAQ